MPESWQQILRSTTDILFTSCVVLNEVIKNKIQFIMVSFKEKCGNFSTWDQNNNIIRGGNCPCSGPSCKSACFCLRQAQIVIRVWQHHRKDLHRSLVRKSHGRWVVAGTQQCARISAGDAVKAECWLKDELIKHNWTFWKLFWGGTETCRSCATYWWKINRPVGWDRQSNRETFLKKTAVQRAERPAEGK